MLTEQERNDVIRHVLASEKVRRIYESIAESSQPLPTPPINITTV